MVEERDACGVGFIADLKGKAKPGVVLDKALVALGCMEHRGACSADQVRIKDERGERREMCFVVCPSAWIKYCSLNAHAHCHNMHGL